MADLLESKPFDEAIEAMLADPGRRAVYDQVAWLEDFDRRNLRAMNPVGVPRAIRDVVADFPVRDRELLAAVHAPTLVISRDGDPVHLLLVGQELARVMSNAELVAYPSGDAMFADLPNLVARVSDFLSY